MAGSIKSDYIPMSQQSGSEGEEDSDGYLKDQSSEYVDKPRRRPDNNPMAPKAMTKVSNVDETHATNRPPKDLNSGKMKNSLKLNNNNRLYPDSGRGSSEFPSDDSPSPVDPLLAKGHAHNGVPIRGAANCTSNDSAATSIPSDYLADNDLRPPNYESVIFDSSHGSDEMIDSRV